MLSLHSPTCACMSMQFVCLFFFFFTFDGFFLLIKEKISFSFLYGEFTTNIILRWCHKSISSVEWFWIILLFSGHIFIVIIISDQPNSTTTKRLGYIYMKPNMPFMKEYTKLHNYYIYKKNLFPGIYFIITDRVIANDLRQAHKIFWLFTVN